MKRYYFAVIFLALVQPQVSWFLLPAFPVALASIRKEGGGSEVFFLAFFAGLLVDFFGGTILGTASIFLLLESIVLERVRGRLRTSLGLAIFIGLVCSILFKVVV